MGICTSNKLKNLPIFLINYLKFINLQKSNQTNLCCISLTEWVWRKQREKHLTSAQITVNNSCLTLNRISFTHMKLINFTRRMQTFFFKSCHIKINLQSRWIFFAFILSITAGFNLFHEIVKLKSVPSFDFNLLTF